jgi:2-hydroxy-3-keto-5-methylthiopentenyl-1-phosphate phosphatase
MLPAIYDNKNIASITVNGNIKHFTVKLVKSSQYAFVTVKGGMNYNIRAAYLN